MIVVGLIAGALLILGGWHWTKLESIVRPRIPKMAEEEFRVAVWYWVWHRDMPDRARHHAVRMTVAGTMATLLMSIVIWQAVHPAFAIVWAGAAMYGLFDVLWKFRTFERERRSPIA
ncbi:hypothetical protein [Methylobacterium aquaticum]|jgi:hypothetical protein|uniref:Transmembrane protein n=1 Tax=Methylobacterium aquaticum TaxID=270351 RepID=A0A0J6SCQ9_9HYPH|nr:hypothetical protein [Methylobacterium aquaticum]KMO31497.1 hypothetical protein VP06_19535 [Methylobacterium aquaticum]